MATQRPRHPRVAPVKADSIHGGLDQVDGGVLVALQSPSHDETSGGMHGRSRALPPHGHGADLDPRIGVQVEGVALLLRSARHVASAEENLVA